MKVGDTVQWTHVSQRGRKLSMSLRQGVIDGFSADGKHAHVRYGKKTVLKVLAKRLRPLDAPTQLGEFVEALRDASRKEPA